MPEHAAFVEPVPVRDRTVPKFLAVCSCGWRAGEFERRGHAQTAAVEHAIGHEAERRPKQQRPTGFFG